MHENLQTNKVFSWNGTQQTDWVKVLCLKYLHARNLSIAEQNIFTLPVELQVPVLTRWFWCGTRAFSAFKGLIPTSVLAEIKLKLKFFSKKHSTGNVHTFTPSPAQKCPSRGKRRPCYSQGSVQRTSPLLAPGSCRQRSETKTSNMADEDLEMDNFSEDRAESASDFAGDDENEKVTWLWWYFS